MKGDSLRLVAESRLYRTPCVPRGAGPDYVNAAALVETSLRAPDLLALLHRIEADFDRQRVSRWAARTLDLDLLDWGGVVLPDSAAWTHWRDLPFESQKSEAPGELILPHPRLQDRAFVLVPVCDIAPEWRHPVLGETAAALLAALPAADRHEIQPLRT